MKIALVLALAGAYFLAVMMGYAIIEEGSQMYRDSDFWLIAFVMLSFYVTTFGHIHAAAASQIAGSAVTLGGKPTWVLRL